MRRYAAVVVLACAAGMILQQPTLAQQPSTNSRQIITRMIPRYPELARQLRLEGSVKLMVLVAPNGSVKAVRPMGGNPVLLKAAQDVIPNWKWTPAPVESQELVELRFHPD